MYESVAPNIAKSLRALACGVFETRPASPASHPYVAWRRYASATRRLAALGFRRLGDVEVTSVAVDARTSRPAVLRLLASEDGEIVVAMYRMSFRWTLAGIRARWSYGTPTMMDFLTHLADGTTVETSTAELASVWNDGPFRNRAFMSPSTPLDGLVAHHRERLAAHVAAAPGRAVVHHRTLESTLAAAADTERRKREYRESIGWVTEEELARLSKLDGDQLAELVAAVRAALAAGEPPDAPGQRAA